jgi:hypothetical protein
MNNINNFFQLKVYDKSSNNLLKYLLKKIIQMVAGRRSMIYDNIKKYYIITINYCNSI